MHKQRLVILIGAAAGLPGIFLPWIKSPLTGALNGINFYTGWTFLLLFIIALISALIGDRTTCITGWKLIFIVPPGMGAALRAIYDIFNFQSMISSMVSPGELQENDYLSKQLVSIMKSLSFSLGIGLFIVAIAGIAICISGYYFQFKKEKQEKEKKRTGLAAPFFF